MTGEDSQRNQDGTGTDTATDVKCKITERPVDELSKQALKTEWSEVYKRLVAGTVEDRDAAWNRRHELWDEMCRRTNAEPPTCPECSAKSWSQDFGGSKRCNSCNWMPDSEDMDIIKRIDEYWSTVTTVPESDNE